eukprot:352945-Chlamydomonas_euryale.AAC.8
MPLYVCMCEGRSEAGVSLHPEYACSAGVFLAHACMHMNHKLDASIKPACARKADHKRTTAAPVGPPQGAALKVCCVSSPDACHDC